MISVVSVGQRTGFIRAAARNNDAPSATIVGQTMFFASPLWLLAMVPWAGVTLWLLWGRRPKTPVPFLELWRGPALQRPAKAGVATPGDLSRAGIGWDAIASILAAAGPAIHTRRAGRPIMIIVDCGMTMSASNPARFVAASLKAKEHIASLLPSATPVELRIIPGNATFATTVGQWTDSLNSISPTALDTRARIGQSIRERLLNSPGAVILISDHRTSINDPRVIQFRAG